MIGLLVWLRRRRRGQGQRIREDPVYMAGLTEKMKADILADRMKRRMAAKEEPIYDSIE